MFLLHRCQNRAQDVPNRRHTKFADFRHLDPSENVVACNFFQRMAGPLKSPGIPRHLYMCQSQGALSLYIDLVEHLLYIRDYLCQWLSFLSFRSRLHRSFQSENAMVGLETNVFLVETLRRSALLSSFFQWRCPAWKPRPWLLSRHPQAERTLRVAMIRSPAAALATSPAFGLRCRHILQIGLLESFLDVILVSNIVRGALFGACKAEGGSAIAIAISIFRFFARIAFPPSQIWLPCGGRVRTVGRAVMPGNNTHPRTIG
jgi:hypothetical protein